MFVVNIIIWFFVALSWYKIFEKVKIPGWKALIPFYEEYTRFKLAGKKGWYFPYLLVSFISGIVDIIYMSLLALSAMDDIIEAFLESGIHMDKDLTVLFVLHLCIGAVVSVVKIMIGIIISNGFGKTYIFGVGLGLFPIVFAPILAFGNAIYRDKYI